jgi:hypothetical protein
MVLGVPAGPWASYAMVDDDFQEPTHAELRQTHIRAALLAVHPCRGQWVRDEKGRLGVLAADQDWKNDPLYNTMLHSPGNSGAAGGAPAGNGGAAGGAASVNAHAQAAGPHVIDLTGDSDVIDMTGDSDNDAI